MGTVVAVRCFFSPQEHRILQSLPVSEAALIEALHEQFDATLVHEDVPAAAEQPTLFDLAA